MIAGAAPAVADVRILSLGDSYTIGEAVAAEDAWPTRLAALLRRQGMRVAPPTVIARTGWTTDELASAIREANPAPSYDIVTVLVGVNDQYRGHRMEDYRDKFRTLLDTAVGFAGGRADRVIVLSIPDWGATPFAAGRDRADIARAIDGFNAANRAETSRARARYVDVAAVSRRVPAEPDLVAADGLHPSGRMYAEWAGLVLPEVRAALG